MNFCELASANQLNEMSLSFPASSANTQDKAKAVACDNVLRVIFESLAAHFFDRREIHHFFGCDTITERSTNSLWPVSRRDFQQITKGSVMVPRFRGCHGCHL